MIFLYLEKCGDFFSKGSRPGKERNYHTVLEIKDLHVEIEGKEILVVELRHDSAHENQT